MPESLQTIAEISIAIAGFTGLVVALRRTQGSLNEVEKFRLKLLLSLAFGAMFLSFLPEWLQDLGIAEERIWVYSCATLCVYSVVFVSSWVARSRRVAEVAPEIFNWSAFARMLAGHLIVMVLQLTVVFSLVETKGPAIFVGGLVWYLLHAAQQFGRMLFIQPKN